jgi:hypothetical protein
MLERPEEESGRTRQENRILGRLLRYLRALYFFIVRPDRGGRRHLHETDEPTGAERAEGQADST